MQRITNKNSSRNITVVIILVIALIAAAVYLIALNGRVFDAAPSSEGVSPQQNDTPTDEQIQAGNDIKEQTIKENPTQNPASPQTTVSVTATRSAQTLRVQTTIGKVTNQGTCTLTLSSTDSSVIADQKTYTAEVQALSSYSTCKGFSIDLSDFGEGRLDILVTFKDSSTEGTASTSVTL